MRWRPNDAMRQYVAACLIVIAGLLTYANSLSGPLLFDDQSAIISNPQIRRLWPLIDALAPPRDSVLTSRPFVNFSFAVNYAIGGVSVRGYHVVNLSLHLVSSLLLFGVVRRTLLTSKLRDRFAPRSTAVALACALIWMLHPLQTEAVDYITQRTELMMGLFYLLTMYCAIRAIDAAAPERWRAAAIVSCLVGMGCKETMATAPLIVVLYDRVFLFDSVREAWRRRKTVYVGLAVSWLEFAGILMLRDETAGFRSNVSAWTYLLNQAQMITEYLKLTVWPRALVFDYGLPRQLRLTDVLPQLIFVSMLVILTGIALVFRPMAGFLGAWFFVILAPASSVIPVLSEVGAERRMYLPLAGLVVLAVIGGYRLLERMPARAFRPVALAGTIVVAGALAYATVRRNHEYAVPVLLMQGSVDRWPQSRARFNLAAVLKADGRVDEAIAQLRIAVPDNPQAQYVLGSELYDRGQFDDAIRELRRFTGRFGPTPTASAVYEIVAARNLIALSLAQQRKLPEAVEEFERALQLDPDNADLHGNLAFILMQQRDFERARRHYEAQLKDRTGTAFALTNLGIALQELGRIEEAKARFRQALAIDPNYPEARIRLDRATHPRS